VSDDLILKRLIEMQERLDAQLLRLNELERLLNRMCELNRMIVTGAAPPPSPPPPSVN
jgi:hypothetical protein